MKYKVESPDKAYSGVVGGVQFSGGRAEMDGATDRAALAYCQRRGYTVTPVEEPKRASSRTKKTDE